MGDLPGSIGTAREPAAAHRSWPTWLLAFALLLALHVLWALAIPAAMANDEPEHASWAAAIWRGEWHPPTTGDQDARTGYRLVTVPRNYDGSTNGTCQYPTVADIRPCLDAIAADGTLVQGISYTGDYPPLYSLLVGWVTFGHLGWVSYLLLRIVSAVVVAAIEATAFTVLRGVAGRWAPIGFGLALTPTVLFLGGSLNPNALEVAAALLAWCAGLAVVRTAVPTGRQFAALAAGVGILMLARGMSPVWAVLVAVAVGALLPAARWPGMLHRRGFQAVVGVGLVTGVVATVWLLWAKPYNSIVSAGEPAIPDPWQALGASLQLTGFYLQQSIGQFGWARDQLIPWWLAAVWLLAVAGMLVVALRRSDFAARLVVVLLIAAIALVPTLAQWGDTMRIGVIWQGRYTLPLVVGLPLVLAHLLDRAAVRMPRGVLPLAMTAIWLVDALAFASMLWRYAIGKGVFPGWGPIGWEPPIVGFWGALVLAALLQAAFLWLLSRMPSPPRAAPARPWAGAARIP